jgi:orotate phosphoribosyltransferase
VPDGHVPDGHVPDGPAVDGHVPDGRATEALRRELAARVVAVLGLPGSVAGDDPRLDKYLMQADPECLRGVTALLAGQLPPDTEALAGIELGGVPLAAALALCTGLPWAVVRRAGRGLSGTPVDGRRTVLVKDMTRSGAAITAAAGLLREHGAVVTHAAVGLNWNPELAALLRPVGVRPVTALTLPELRQAWRAQRA